jgi:hypothetical protein
MRGGAPGPATHEACGRNSTSTLYLTVSNDTVRGQRGEAEVGFDLRTWPPRVAAVADLKLSTAVTENGLNGREAGRRVAQMISCKTLRRRPREASWRARGTRGCPARAVATCAATAAQTATLSRRGSCEGASPSGRGFLHPRSSSGRVARPRTVRQSTSPQRRRSATHVLYCMPLELYFGEPCV